MVRVNPSELSGWGRASKTKNILARPMSTLVIDSSITAKLVLETLEGKQKLNDKSMVCKGVASDFWQQTKDKLLSKYDVIDITDDSWMVCKPKPDNEVESIQIISDMINGERDFEIIGLWGIETPEGFIQNGEVGDYICRNLTDGNDVWIVKNFIFRNSYDFVKEISMKKVV